MSLANDVETMSMDGKRVGDVLPKLNQDQTRSIHYFTIAPTMFLSLHPDYVLIHLIQRDGVSESSVRCQFLFHPSTVSSKDFEAGSIVEFWDLTNLGSVGVISETADHSFIGKISTSVGLTALNLKVVLPPLGFEKVPKTFCTSAIVTLFWSLPIT